MTRNPTIFGISMASKTSRRWLVLVCYVVLCFSILLAFSSRTLEVRFALTVIMNMVFGSVQFVIFFKLAKDTVLLPMHPDLSTVSLGLLRKESSSTSKLDEREVAIRNAAYYKAYRVIVTVCLLLMPVIMNILMSPLSEVLLALFMCSFLILALTLPQAIILWTEPDLPEEMG